MNNVPKFSFARSSMIFILLLLVVSCQVQEKQLNVVESSLAYVHPAIEDKYSSKGSGFIIAKNKYSNKSTFYVLTAHHLVGMLSSSDLVVTTHVDKKNTSGYVY